MQTIIYGNELVDIRDVIVDKNMSKQERITDFAKQIKNPHKFRCGEFTITASFSKDGPTLENCLQRLMT